MLNQDLNEPHLRVFENRSELHLDDGSFLEFHEGKRSDEAVERNKKILDTLKKGYLSDIIELCIRNDEPQTDSLNSVQHSIIDELVSSITADYGRALLGLSVLQLYIKTVTPSQSIRLHKSNIWTEGLSMRSLDKAYMTPILRKYNLMKLNADGFMMTRTLAENYPYSRFYKANIKGAYPAWVNLVEELEHTDKPMNARAGLNLIISKLLNNAEEFAILSQEAIGITHQFTTEFIMSIEQAIALIKQHWLDSNYAARVMEVSMHAFIQALQDMDLLDSTLKPLSQMRSANKKHGNIGDIELLDHNLIIESWDAKYGKSYLHEELDELGDKLNAHNSVKIAGFVTSAAPDMSSEIQMKINEVSGFSDVEVQILSFEDWIYYQLNKLDIVEKCESDIVAIKWLTAYTETLALKRIELAPIDEPCQQWLDSWVKILKNI